MKSLLRMMGLTEAITGLALLIVPAFIVSVLLGSTLTGSTAILMARLSGSALFTVAIACLFANTESEFYLVVRAMLVYNILATALLVYSGVVENLAGPGLWPAVVLHIVFIAWCILSISGRLSRK